MEVIQYMYLSLYSIHLIQIIFCKHVGKHFCLGNNYCQHEMCWNLRPCVAVAKTFYSFHQFVLWVCRAELCTVLTVQRLSTCLGKICHSYNMYWKLSFDMSNCGILWQLGFVRTYFVQRMCKHSRPVLETFTIWSLRPPEVEGWGDLDTVSSLLKAPFSRTKTAVVMIVWCDH